MIEIPALMFLAVCLVLLAGFPVALTLAGVGLLFAAIGTIMGTFDASYLAAIPARIFGTIGNETLIAVPLFILMGNILERAKIAEDLLNNMAQLLGSRPGGLGIAVVIVGALLAASTGIVGATVVTMGLLSLPSMLRAGYSPALAAGTICATGTLGQIIPPSIALVLLGDVIASAYQRAQLDLGVVNTATVSVGDLFVGALIPGLILVAFYLLWILLVARIRPQLAPAIAAEGASLPELFSALLPPFHTDRAGFRLYPFGRGDPHRSRRCRCGWGAALSITAQTNELDETPRNRSIDDARHQHGLSNTHRSCCFYLGFSRLWWGRVGAGFL